MSCRENNGMHIQEDYFYAEIIDPDTLEVLPDGEKGELVITTIGKEGMPLVRYRTRDICYKLYVGREKNTDTFELAVELAEGLAIDDISFVETLRGRIEHALRDMLGIGCKVKLLNAGTLPRSEGKAVRVEDTRKLG